MAYGLRYRIEYKDRNEVLTQINMYCRDYAGSADVRYAHAAFKAEWGDQGEVTTLPQVYGSSVTIYFDAEVDYEYLDIFSADARKTLIEVKKAGVVFGRWFAEPDAWSEPLIAPPYPCELTGYDGLGYLDEVDFIAGGEGNERQTVRQILTDIIDSIGLGLDIVFDIDMQESEGDNFLDVTYDTTQFVDKSKLDVLKQLTLGCRVQQRAGKWLITSNNQLLALQTTYPTYWREGEAKIDVLPALKNIKVKQTYGYQDNLFTNGSFNTYNEELRKFETWTNVDVFPLQSILNKDGDKYVWLPGREYPDWFDREGYGYITAGIKKRLPIAQTNGTLKFSLDYALYGSKYSCYMFIRIKLYAAGNTYFLRRRHYVADSNKPIWEWINLNDKPSLGDDTICLKSHLEKSSARGHKGEYYNTYDKVTAYSYLDVVDHFEKFNATVEGLPASGQIEIQLLVPYTDRGEIYGSCYTAVQLEISGADDEKYPTDKTYDVVNDLNNNYRPDDLDLLVGDYPNILNNTLIYKGGFRRSDDITPTTAWKYTGGAIGYSFAEFIGRSIAASMLTPRQVMVALLSDLIPLNPIVVEDADNPGKKFIEVGITYNDETQTCDGSYAEMADFNIDFSEVTASTKSAQVVLKKEDPVAQAINLEERVQLVDDNGALVSAPGYLYDKDFESKPVVPEDEEDGFTRLRIKKEAITPYNLDQAAGQLQFSITSACEMNFNGNANQVRFDAGAFLIHNWNALSKDERLNALPL